MVKKCSEVDMSKKVSCYTRVKKDELFEPRNAKKKMVWQKGRRLMEGNGCVFLPLIVKYLLPNIVLF